MPKTKDAFAFRDVVSKILAYEIKLSQVHNKYGEDFQKKSKNFLASKDFVELRQLHSVTDETFYRLIKKGFDEPPITSDGDRIGAIEQSIRRFSHILKRVNFLIERVENHCRRLLKYRTRCKMTSKNFEQAAQLENHYLLLLSNLKSAGEFAKDALDFNSKTLKTAFNEEFGIRLRLCRRQKNFSRDDVAKFLGVTKAAYAHYETGRRETPILFVYRLANFFNVSTDYLLGRQKQNNSNA